jgi:hypothetical protein
MNKRSEIAIKIDFIGHLWLFRESDSNLLEIILSPVRGSEANVGHYYALTSARDDIAG